MHRRKLLMVTGTITIPALAGCTGDEETDNGEVEADEEEEDEESGTEEENDEAEEEPEDDEDDEDGGDDASYIDETDGPIDLMFGETAAVSFGIEYTVQDLELVDEYEREGTGRTEEAPDGSQYAIVSVSVHNGHDGRVLLPRATEFAILDGEGGQYDRDVYGHADEYEGGEVQPDITREGIIMYEIPADHEVGDLLVTLARDGRDPDGNPYEMNVRWSEDGESR
jgi:hypothetical protein